ncbi:hypothetical protein AHAS_Ahas15G0220500 [Arachis hypogaea]
MPALGKTKLGGCLPQVGSLLLSQPMRHTLTEVEKLTIFTNRSSRVLRHTRDEQVGWEMPEENWVKLSVDGSVIQPGSQGSCGSILRNIEGDHIAGFSMNIGWCSITMAEFWGIYVGVKLAVDLETTNLMVESDSTCA